MLELVGLGYSANEIGVALGISASAVVKHKKAVMNKAGAARSAELVRLAVGLGLVPTIDASALLPDGGSVEPLD